MSEAPPKPPGPESSVEATRVAVYVCTYRRNEPLARLLDSLESAAERAAPEIQLAVVVVDDNPDRAAEAVVEASNHSFPGGLHYTWVGAGNIATARNAGVEAAMDLAPWVAMVDDDQVVVPEWLVELMAVQRRTGADAVTAPVYPRFPDEAPRFLHDEPFADLWGTPMKADGAPVTDLQTANSMIRTSFLAEHPEVRFSTDLGRVGGEDMVFYRAALDRGLRAHFSLHAINWEFYDGERATYGYQLRRALWLGNTEAVTNLRAGRASRARLVVRAAKRGVVTMVGPATRAVSGEPVQLRFSVASALQSIGMILGAAGVRLEHR